MVAPEDHYYSIRLKMLSLDVACLFLDHLIIYHGDAQISYEFLE